MMQVHNDDSHRSTPLIDLQMGRLENFLIVGHEAGGAGKRHMKNASLGRGRTLYQEELYQNYWHTVVHLHCGETPVQRRWRH